MPLAALQKFDKPTANTILAAAALYTAPQPGVDDETAKFFDRYKVQVSEVLSEIRRTLRLAASDTSPKARATIDEYLSKALEDYVVTDNEASKALVRAAQQGRLNPAAYRVVQPQGFRDRFFELAVKKSQIEEAVRHPDDYQHLLTEGAVEDEADIFSLFMKEASRKRHHPNWLLVQCFRKGIEQEAQSAWRVYPDEVDLTSAEYPLDVLKAFVEKFGLEVKVGDLKGKFIETMSMLKVANSDVMQFGVEVVNPPKGPNQEFFISASNRRTSNPNLFKVGLVYCIDIRRYRKSLMAHGAGVRSR